MIEQSIQSGFFLAVEQAADSIMITDREGRIVYVNPAFTALTGWSRSRVLGQTPGILKSSLHSERYFKTLWERLLEGKTFRGVFANKKLNGELFYEDKNIAPIFDQRGEITHFVSAGRDITAHKSAEAERSRLLAVLEATTDLVAVADAEGRISYLNPAGRALLGLGGDDPLPAEILEAGPHELFSFEDDAPIVVGDGTKRVEALIRDRGRGQTPVSVLLIDQKKGGARRLVAAIARDITRRKQQEADLRYAADHDHLTGLFNRRRFERDVEFTFSPAGGHGEVTLLLLDLDDFKSINDTFGHSVGDEVLQAVGLAMSRALDPAGVLARMGGDEFAVLFRGTDSVTAQRAAEKLLDELRRERIQVHGHTVRITASIGLSTLPARKTSFVELMANADLALYKSKNAGGNTFRSYDPTDESKASSQSRVDWRTHVVEALEHDLFSLHWQPILNLKSNEVEKYEVLLRTQDGSLPGDFIVRAERYGLIQEIDRWVMRRAIAMLPRLNHGGKHVQVSVNVSAASMSSTALLEIMDKDFTACGADPSELIVEITETAAIQNMSDAKVFVEKLKALGCQVALDDFGSGHSSLIDARDLAVDYLKIDGSFVTDLTLNASNELIIRAIVAFAQALGRRTVAEYVDNVSTAQRLAEIGVDFAQGFFVGRPRAIEETPSLHARGDRRPGLDAA